MNVLLTGPFGKIGYRVIEALLERGHRVTCFDLDTPANRKTAQDFSGLAFRDRVHVTWGNITDPAQVAAAVAGQDAVVHNAALIPPHSDLNPALAEKVNVGGTQHILEAIRQSDRKPLLVFPSSISVHGFNQPADPYPKRIDSPFRAEDAYAGHKIRCEQMIEEASKAWGLQWVIVRIGACMEGRNPMDTENSEQMMQMMFNVAADVRLEYIHPKDVACAMANALSTPKAIGHKYFLGGGKSCQTTWREFNSMFLVAMGCKPFPASVFGTQGYYTDWMDTDESQRVLRFQHHTLQDYRDELDRKFKWVRPLLWPLRGLILHYLVSQSPHHSK